MPKRINVVVVSGKGTHDVTSPKLSDEEAAEHIEEIGKYMSTPNKVKLPWLVVNGAGIAAAYIEERADFKVRSGASEGGESLLNKPM